MPLNTIPTNKFFWFIRGKFLNLLELNDDGFLVPPTKDVSFIRGQSDGEDVYGGLQLEMTKVPFRVDEITNESHEIPVNEALEEAVIDYVKAQLADDAQDPRVREYFMKRFRRKVSRFGTTRTGGARVVAGNSFMR